MPEHGLPCPIASTVSRARRHSLPGHMAKQRVAVVASGVDQPDLHTGAFETVGQMIQFHHPLTPANQSLARKVWKGLLQGTKPDQIGAVTERRIGDKAVPMIGRRFT